MRGKKKGDGLKGVVLEIGEENPGKMNYRKKKENL